MKIALAAVLVALFAVLGLASAPCAAADGHNVVNPDATWGSQDGVEQRGVDIKPAVQATDLSADVIPTWPKTPKWSPPTWGTYPVEPSYPAPASWPGFGFGVDDREES